MVGRFERNKDTAQEIAEATTTRVGAVIGIIVTAVRDVTVEIGGLVTDAIETREAARRAREDDERAHPATDTEAVTERGPDGSEVPPAHG